MFESIVTPTESMEQDIYIGMTEKPLETRYNLHNSSFTLPHKRSTTTLSEHLWAPKDAGPSWMKAKPCSPAARKCDLCLAEKYCIFFLNHDYRIKEAKFLEPAPTEENTFFQNSDRRTEENSP